MAACTHRLNLFGAHADLIKALLPFAWTLRHQRIGADEFERQAQIDGIAIVTISQLFSSCTCRASFIDRHA